MTSPLPESLAPAHLPTACKRVGILGGTFNPVHIGHVQIAHCARDRFNLDCVLWIPAGIPPHKPLAAGASNADRLEMVKRAIAAEPTFSWSDIELARQGKSYAIDTLVSLQQQYPTVSEWHWIIGLDAIRDLPTWHRATEIVRLCHWIVAPRPGDTQASTGFINDLSINNLSINESGQHQPASEILKAVTDRLPHLQTTLLDCEAIAVSSTQVRDLLERSQSITGLVPEGVETFIQERQLYGLTD